MWRQTKEELQALLANKKRLYFVERGDTLPNSFRVYFEDNGEIIQIRPKNREHCPFFVPIIDWGEYETGGFFVTDNRDPLYGPAQIHKIGQALGEWLFGDPNKFIALLL